MKYSGRLGKQYFSSVLFSVLLQQKYAEVAIKDFATHLIISKWLRTQKCRQRRKTMTQTGRSERTNCHRKCFHSFNYGIDHASIRFFFYIFLLAKLQFWYSVKQTSVIHKGQLNCQYLIKTITSNLAKILDKYSCEEVYF